MPVVLGVRRVPALSHIHEAVAPLIAQRSPFRVVGINGGHSRRHVRRAAAMRLTPGNSIGLHRVEIASVDGGRVRVRKLEAVDGTPILDVKPVLRGDIRER